jgi:hypothetical protein
MSPQQEEMTMKKKIYRTSFSFLIDAFTHRKLKDASKKSGRPMSHIIRDGIDMKLRKIDSQDGKILLMEDIKNDRTDE